MTTTVIVSSVRTPIGSFQGALASLSAPQLGALSIRAAIEKAGLQPKDVQEVIMGNVLSAGIGQAPARQAALAATLPRSTGCLTINKVCGSGLKAVMLADAMIKNGDADIVVAGGMESMSNTPYYLPKARSGLRLGNATLIDGLVHDGLWDPYNNFHMGSAGELCAREKKISREAQDEYAIESYKRAQQAQADGLFKDEMFTVTLSGKKGEIKIAADEEPQKFQPEKFRELKPAFDPKGTITAGNASSINDGASSLVLMSESAAKQKGLKPLARIVSHAGAAQEPEWFTTAPALAITKALAKAGLKKSDIDFWEINEAFAVVALVTMNELGLSHKQVNPRGGAIALGHPIGASGARILTTLLHTLKQTKTKRGCASLCIGGGEAVAMIVETM